MLSGHRSNYTARADWQLEYVTDFWSLGRKFSPPLNLVKHEEVLLPLFANFKATCAQDSFKKGKTNLRKCVLDFAIATMKGLVLAIL
jgi:hypothetical protein